MFLLGIWCAIYRNDSKRIIKVFCVFIGLLLLFMGYITVTFGVKHFILDNGCGMGFLFTDLLVPLFLLVFFNRNIYYYVSPSMCKIQEMGGVKTTAKNTLYIYYGTNIAMLTYNLIEAPRSIMAIIFLMALIFASYIFARFTNHAISFFSTQK